jgi:hypothetical protein
VEKDISALFRARSPEASRELERFKQAYKEHARIFDQVALSILIWGPPQDSNSSSAKVLLDIRQSLLDKGYVAFLSDDLATGANAFKQAQAADMVIVVLPDEPYFTIEQLDVAMNPAIASKLFVLAPQRYKDSYGGQALLRLIDEGFGGVYWYTEDELRDGRVRSTVLRRTTARREMYALTLSGRDRPRS